MRALILAQHWRGPPRPRRPPHEHSTTDRLRDRREVAAGTRAYSIGFQDGRFYAHGWHIMGEMGGIWAPPLKLADGVWFGVEDEWVGPPGGSRAAVATPATRSRRRRAEPAPHRLRPGRPPRGALRARAQQPRVTPKTVTVKVDVHSELMGAYPWTGSKGHPTAADNLQDGAAYRNGRLIFTDQGTLPGAEPHEYAAFAAPRAAGLRRDRPRLPRPAARHGVQGRRPGRAVGLRRRAARQGRRRPAALPRHDRRTAARPSGSPSRRPRDAARELAAALRTPTPSCGQDGRPDALAARSEVDLPGDRRLQEAVEWGKQNLADLTQTATELQAPLRRPGHRLPRADHDARPRRSSAPATRTTRGCSPPTASTRRSRASRSASSRRSRRTCALRARLRRAQRPLGQGRARDRLRRLGLLRRQPGPGQHRRVGQVPERGRARVALDRRRRASATSSTTSRGARCATSRASSTPTRTAGPRASATSSARAWARRSSTTPSTSSAASTTSPTWPAPGRQHHGAVGHRLADRARSASTRRGGTRTPPSTPTRSRRRRPVQQRHWIGVTPMEAELPGGRLPASRPAEHAAEALAGARERVLQRGRSVQSGLFHTGCDGGPGRGRAHRVLARHGDPGRRRGQLRARRNSATPAPTPTRCSSRTSSPARCRRSSPRRTRTRNIDRCWTCRAMFMQAWGHYGTAWPVINQQLGVRPALGTGGLEIVPSIPEGQTPDRRARHPARRRRLRRRPRGAQRQPLHDHGHRRRRRAARGLARRRDAPRRRGGRDRHARRRPGAAPDGARDQPRRRGHGAGRRGRPQRGGGDHDVGGYRRPTAGGETGGRHAVEDGGDVQRRHAAGAGDRGSGAGVERE